MFFRFDMKNRLSFVKVFVFIGLILSSRINPAQDSDSLDKNNKIVESIVVSGNRKISEKAIIAKLLFKEGDLLKDCSKKAGDSLKRVAFMGYFADGSLKLKTEPGSSSDKVKLVLELEEKKLLSGYEFTGNENVSLKKLRSSLNLDAVNAIDSDDVERMCRQIEKIYRKENYLAAKATGSLFVDGPESFKILFSIVEGPKTKVLRVKFVGCKKILERKLREVLATKEDWLLAAVDGAGKYDKDMVERDKHVIEQFYQDHGYLNVSVPEAKIDRAANNKDLEITFYIEEGELYTVSRIGVPYDIEFNAEMIEQAILLKEGAPYSLSNLKDSMTRLEYVFGESGYIFLNVYPEIIPDHKNHTVEIKFSVEKGNKYKINDIEITGNLVTRDFVIRRELLVHEGMLAVKRLMDRSRERVEYLDYFDRGSVDWKIHKIDDEKVNLELIVKEKKSGQASLSLNYGANTGGKSAPAFVFDAHKRNFKGIGWDVGGGLQIGEGAVKLAFMDFENPYLLDRDVNFGCRAYVSRVDFDCFDPVEETIGAVTSVGFGLNTLGQRLRFTSEVGFEGVDYKVPSSGNIFDKSGNLIADLSTLASSENPVFRQYKKDFFTGGDYAWFGGKVSLDNLNYRINPTKGWSLELRDKVALSGFGSSNSNVDNPRIEGHSMFKLELDASFYWPIIDKSDRLVFSAKSRLGIIEPLFDSRKMPVIHKELFKVGGIHSLRGFRWGEAGPLFKTDKDAWPIPIGAKRMFVTNFELSTPVCAGSNAPIGFLFYDIGAGWNAQRINLTSNEVDTYVVNDKFSLRHAVGLGIKFSVPYPIRIDYGYKLNRRGGESSSELNISMNMPF